MKHFILLFALLSSTVQAVEAVDCFATAGAANWTAKERDAGTPQKDAPHEVNAYIHTILHARMAPEAVDNMVETIYNAPEVTADQVYSRVLEQCIALTAPSKLTQNQK